MRARICSSESRTCKFGLLNSELICAEEVANSFSFSLFGLISKTFAWAPCGATYYASSSLKSMRHSPNFSLRTLLLVTAFVSFVAPSFAQSTAIQPCDATTSATKPITTNAPVKIGLVALVVASQGWIAVDCANEGATNETNAVTSSKVRSEKLGL